MHNYHWPLGSSGITNFAPHTSGHEISYRTQLAELWVSTQSRVSKLPLTYEQISTVTRAIRKWRHDTLINPPKGGSWCDVDTLALCPMPPSLLVLIIWTLCSSRLCLCPCLLPVCAHRPTRKPSCRPEHATALGHLIHIRSFSHLQLDFATAVVPRVALHVCVQQRLGDVEEVSDTLLGRSDEHAVAQV